MALGCTFIGTTSIEEDLLTFSCSDFEKTVTTLTIFKVSTSCGDGGGTRAAKIVVVQCKQI
jgi:hypothetical protein